MQQQALTLRLKPELLESCKRIAEERKVSLNSLLSQMIEEMARAEKSRKLRAAFDQLADEDVSYAVHAQQEVMLADDF